MKLHPDVIADMLPIGTNLEVLWHRGRQGWGAVVEAGSPLHRMTVSGVACWAWWPTLAAAGAWLADDAREVAA